MKKLLSILLIGLITTILIPFNVEAKSISTLDAVEKNNKITVSGTTENGVLAIAVLVYSRDELVDMETCSNIDNKYSCELNKTFDIGKYTIKVADYDGGDYITDDISITVNNPKTYDGILLYIGLGIISLLGVTGSILYYKKSKN